MLRSILFRRLSTNLSIRKFTTRTTQHALDVYHESIRSTTDLNRVWELVSTHEKNMNETHVIATLKVLKKLLLSSEPSKKSSLTDDDLRTLLRNENFERLCSHTLQIMRSMSPVNLAELLSLLTYLSIPTKTLIFQALLTSIKNQLNEFSLTDIAKMDRALAQILKRGKKDYLVDAIRVALPVLLEIKAQFNEIPYDDLDSMVSILRLATSHKVKISVVNKLMEAIYTQHVRLDSYQSFSVFCSTAKASNYDELEFDSQLASNLASTCLSKLATPENPKFENDVRFIFEKVFLRKHPGYSYDFFEKAAAIYKKEFPSLNFDTIERVLAKFDGYNHVDFELVNSYEKKIKLERSNFVARETPLVTLYNFTSVIRYKPFNGWDFIFQIVDDQFKLARKSMRTSQLLKLTSLYCYLNEFPSSVIEELEGRLSTFGGDWHEDQLPRSKGRKDFQYLVDINVAIQQVKELASGKQLSPAFDKLKLTLPTFVTPAINALDAELKANLSNFKALHDVLALLVGGYKFFQPLVWTRDGLAIHNLVTYDENKIALDFSSSKNASKSTTKPTSTPTSTSEPLFVEDFNRPAKSMSISFFPLTEGDLTKQGSLRSNCRFRIEAIRNRGIEVVSVDLKHFSSLDGKKQASYLKELMSRKLSQPFDPSSEV